MIEQLMYRFYADLWNRWDDSAVEEVLSPDFRFRGSFGHAVQGRQGWREYRDLVRSGSGDFHNEIVDVVISGHRAAVRLEYSGTHSGLLLGCEPTGRRFSYPGAAFFTSSADRLIEAWVVGDLSSLRAQLG